ASRGTLIATRGTLEDGVAIRVVASEGGAQVAVWAQATLETALATCPWVLDALRREADRLQALAGATIGPLGDLDETLRNPSLGRMSVRHIAPNATVVPKGTQLPGLAIVGAGSLAIGDGGEREAGPGDFLFASQVMRAEPAPETARAGSSGALILMADRQLA